MMGLLGHSESLGTEPYSHPVTTPGHSGEHSAGLGRGVGGLSVEARGRGWVVSDLSLASSPLVAPQLDHFTSVGVLNQVRVYAH
jgi:hypothetical protein